MEKEAFQKSQLQQSQGTLAAILKKMKQSNIRTSLIVFLGLTLFSCANSKTNKQNTKFVFQLIKTEKLTNYKLFSFATNSDTILVVAKNNITEDCIKENFGKLTIQNNNRIYKLNDNGEEILFQYYIKGGENNNLKILTSPESPGNSKKHIFSYNSLPYFMEYCNISK